jgi:large subunit ribosomal protein L17
MKHLKKVRKFKRTKDQRQALIKTMLGSLIMREKITVTESKAKELKSLIDPIINRSKKIKTASQKVGAIRHLSRLLPRVAVIKLSGNFVNRFAKKNSGFCRIVRIASRKSDAARMAIIEFVE